MRTASRHFTGLSRHMSRYNIVDAKIDNPHLPTRELPAIVDRVLREEGGLPPRPRRRLRDVLMDYRARAQVSVA